MAFKGWETAQINSDDGNQVSAIQPVIVSASRSTDIPAFHHRWFFDRLQKGYIVWRNPFNRNTQYVSFSKTRVFVFWTKNPEKFMERLDELGGKRINYYLQFTLNDYEADGFEPKIPPLQRRLEIFKRLSDKIGKGRVIWRFDPLLTTDKISSQTLIDKVAKVAGELKNHTPRLITSFADIENYKKVERNLDKAGIKWKNFTQDDVPAIAKGLKQIGEHFGLEILTCAEKFDLSKFGIDHAKCIDGDLMARLFPDDAELMKFLGLDDNAGTLFPGFQEKVSAKFKDKGQRKECGCIVSKDIGQYDTCLHLCTYCYANSSPENVRRNFAQKPDKDCESILCL
jgi:DNA repair photolyase